MTRKANRPAMAKRYGLRTRLYTTRKMFSPAKPAAPQVRVADDGELTRLKQEAGELREVALRQRADFENFRKRTQREKDAVRDAAAEGLLSRILPVIDNIERAIASAASATDVKSLYDGVNMILVQLKRALEAEGLQQVQALNQPFDPALHDALSTEDRDDVADNHVCEELLPGYKFKDKLIRPAMVKVARATVSKEPVS